MGSCAIQSREDSVVNGMEMCTYFHPGLQNEVSLCATAVTPFINTTNSPGSARWRFCFYAAEVTTEE